MHRVNGLLTLIGLVVCLMPACGPTATTPPETPPPPEASADVTGTASVDAVSTDVADAERAVPLPEPVDTNIRVGVYIFPGWYRDQGTTDYAYANHDEESEWRMIAQFAHPRPLLGFYDDSLPEVNDWHIKWAREAGISWFAFDWYWNAGEKRLSRSLEKGFLEAEYNTQMDFCIHWCNHGLDWQQPLDFSEPALLDMTHYLIDHYFTRPNYLRIDGRPVLMIWDSHAVFEANGGETAFRETVLPKLNALCQDAGLGDLFLVHVDNAPLRLAGVQTGDAITGYSYAHLTTDTPFGMPGSAPYAEMVEALPKEWDRMLEKVKLPSIISTQAGWDSTPRTLSDNRNPENRWVRTENSATLFEATLNDGVKRISPELPFFLIEAWNEWGEGSFIEPSASHGFAHLDAVRRVFAPNAPAHDWARPSQAQIDSYSVLKGSELEEARQREGLPDPPPPVIKQSVRITKDPEPLPENLLAEYRFDDVTVRDSLSLSSAMRFLDVEGEAARYEVLGEDPHMVLSGDWGAPAHHRAVAVCVRYDGPALMYAEFFWSTDGESTRSDRARRYDWEADGLFHTFIFTLEPGEETTGKLTSCRFDLPDEPGAIAEIQWVRVFDTTPRQD